MAFSWAGGGGGYEAQVLCVGALLEMGGTGREMDLDGVTTSHEARMRLCRVGGVQDALVRSSRGALGMISTKE